MPAKKPARAPKGGKTPTDAWKNTALHLCAFDGDEAIAKQQLARGLDPNARNKSGETPLLIAVWMSVSPAFVRLLLEHGADASVKNTEGATIVDQIFKRVDGQGQPMTQDRKAIGQLLIAHGAAATPEQARRLGKAQTAPAARAFDAAKAEQDLYDAATKELKRIAKKHSTTTFSAFGFDCDPGNGSLIIKLNRASHAISTKYTLTGDFTDGFEALNNDKPVRALFAAAAKSYEDDAERTKRVMEIVGRVAVRMEADAVFSQLRCSDKFEVVVDGSDEPTSTSRARLKRLRAGRKKRKPGHARGGRAGGR